MYLFTYLFCLIFASSPVYADFNSELPNSLFCAYLDPGTTSVILSAIVGAIVTIWYIVKWVFYKTKRILKKDMGDVTNTDNKKDIESAQK